VPLHPTTISSPASLPHELASTKTCNWLRALRSRPYWSKKLGKDEDGGATKPRTRGVVRVRVSGDRVYLGGQAVTSVRGELV